MSIRPVAIFFRAVSKNSVFSFVEVVVVHYLVLFCNLLIKH